MRQRVLQAQVFFLFLLPSPARKGYGSAPLYCTHEPRNFSNKLLSRCTPACVPPLHVPGLFSDSAGSGDARLQLLALRGTPAIIMRKLFALGFDCVSSN